MNTIVVSFIKVSWATSVALVLLLVTLSILTVEAAGSSLDTDSRSDAEDRTRRTLATAAETLPNGVAAGDTTQTSTLLWARGTTVGDVLFEYSTDPTFNTGVLTAPATVTDALQPVKVEITGLGPATAYFYRVTDPASASAEGLFRTAAPAEATAGLRFGVSGDWNGQLAPYPSIANADERGLDFFVEHGDTVNANSATTLDEFRLKHNKVYSTHLGMNTWADLRASTSILATIDDNDVRDGFAGGAAPSSDPRFDNTGAFINETQLHRDALQAFQEYNPLRDEFYGATGDPRTADKRRLYRFNTYGRDAAAFILDTRSFRDEQLLLDDPTDPVQVLAFLTSSLNDTSRTLLGAQQLGDLKTDLQWAQADGITWKFILVSGPIQNLGVFHAKDRYEGYAAERTDLLRFISQNNIDNVVFIAAGLHGTIVNNLTYQEIPFGPQISTKAFEVIVGPVAIYPPFGPAVIDLAEDYKLITSEEREDYESRPREGKDEFVRQLVDEKLLDPLGYDPVGLDGSDIEATLLQGGYVDAHTYGWTEFEVDHSTQVLTVTNHGIEPYTAAELAANPNDIITRTPTVISQFTVIPKEATDWISVTATTDAASVYPGETATFTLSVAASDGFTGPVILTSRGAPSEATATFDPNPVTPPGTSQLYVATTAPTVVGTYPMTVTGTCGEVSSTTYLTLTVNPRLTLTVAPDVHAVPPGEMARYMISATTSAGFTAPVTLTLQGAPPETIASFDPNPVTSPGTSQLYITTATSTPAGTHAMTVTGTCEQLTDAVSLTLTIEPATIDSTLSLSAQPAAHVVVPGDTAAYTLSVIASEGFADPATLTLESAPSESIVSFVPNPVTPPGTSQLYITTTASTTAGIYAMTTTATSGVLTDTANLTLIVASAPSSLTLSLSPTVHTAKPGQVVSYTAFVAGLNGFSQPVSLTVVGLPTDVGAGWSTNPVVPDSTSVLTLSIPGDPSFGDHSLHVVGIADTQTVVEEIDLTIAYPYSIYLPAILRGALAVPGGSDHRRADLGCGWEDVLL